MTVVQSSWASKTLQTTIQNLDSKGGSSCSFFVLAPACEVAKINGRVLPWSKMRCHGSQEKCHQTCKKRKSLKEGKDLQFRLSRGSDRLP